MCEGSQAFWPPSALSGDGLREGCHRCNHAPQVAVFRSDHVSPLIKRGMSRWLWQDGKRWPQNTVGHPYLYGVVDLRLQP
jgi:hypothetical protein